MAADQITNDGQVNVSGLNPAQPGNIPPMAVQPGQGSTVRASLLAEGSYGATDIQVRQTDMAGNTSTPVSLGVTTVDQSDYPINRCFSQRYWNQW